MPLHELGMDEKTEKFTPNKVRGWCQLLRLQLQVKEGKVIMHKVRSSSPTVAQKHHHSLQPQKVEKNYFCCPAIK